ncbi:MAG TPA: hypothetical protein VMY88_03790 [Acidimicrobiales bacterium]|nr:hypothetical protein [Acidimicrobiales bacterium]
MLGRKKDSTADKDGFFGELFAVKELVIAYVKQETIEPIKGLGRFLAFGMLGSFLLSVGTLMLVLAGLRALQTETGTVFRGNFSWAPYFIVFVAAVGLGGITLTRIGAKK